MVGGTREPPRTASGEFQPGDDGAGEEGAGGHARARLGRATQKTGGEKGRAEAASSEESRGKEKRPEGVHETAAAQKREGVLLSGLESGALVRPVIIWQWSKMSPPGRMSTQSIARSPLNSHGISGLTSKIGPSMQTLSR